MAALGWLLNLGFAGGGAITDVSFANVSLSMTAETDLSMTFTGDPGG